MAVEQQGALVNQDALQRLLLSLTGPTSSTPSSATVHLVSNYTLTALDNFSTFYADNATTWTVTVPAGLTPMPQCAFIAPATGSITLSPTGGALIAGSSSPQAINASNAPNGAYLAPQIGQTDRYGLSSVQAASWANLSGQPTDNVNFNTWAAGYLAQQGTGNKLTGNYTVSSLDHDRFIYLVAQAGNQTFTFPSTLPNNFRCFVGYINTSAAAGRLLLAGSGTSFNWNSQNPESATYVPAVFQNTVTPVYMGRASANSLALAVVTYQGSGNGGNFFVAPAMGTFATS